MKTLDWRIRLTLEAVVLITFASVMASQGAPPWAVTALLYIGTRSSRLDIAGDLGALQVSIKRLTVREDEGRGGDV